MCQGLLGAEDMGTRKKTPPNQRLKRFDCMRGGKFLLVAKDRKHFWLPLSNNNKIKMREREILRNWFIAWWSREHSQSAGQAGELETQEGVEVVAEPESRLEAERCLPWGISFFS